MPGAGVRGHPRELRVFLTHPPAESAASGHGLSPPVVRVLLRATWQVSGGDGASLFPFAFPSLHRG